MPKNKSRSVPTSKKDNLIACKTRYARKKKKNPKKVRLSYTQEKLDLACKALQAGSKIATVSRVYGIPESTLHWKKKNAFSTKRPGPCSILTCGEEQELVDWIIERCKKGVPVTKAQLCESVKVICTTLKKETPFTNDTPGRAWFSAFTKRHPEIVQRISENVSLNRAKVSEYSLKKWFAEIHTYLKQENLISIDADRVFNSNETGVQLNPTPTSVLAPKGHKNVHNIVNNNEKQHITVLVTSNAAGTLAPTLVLFASKSLPDHVSSMAPNDFAFGLSENGWMLAQNFYEYMANIFDPWLTQHKIKRPVVFYVDGHASYMTLHLSKFCSEHQIILIALHPNATRIIQPLDVSFFKTFKVHWRKISQDFCQESLSMGVHKYQCAPLIKRTYETMDIKKIMSNGFRKCGLYPFNSNAVDYEKTTTTIKFNEEVSTSEPAYNEHLPSEKTALQVFESFLNNQLLDSFYSNTSASWNGLKENEGLFKIWYKLKNPDDCKLDISEEMISYETTSVSKIEIPEVKQCPVKCEPIDAESSPDVIIGESIPCFAGDINTQQINCLFF